MVIGLCGKSGSGKSAICSALMSRGAFIIDADSIARDIVDNKLTDRLKIAFPECYNEDVLDRRKLADIVFNNRDKLEVLNSLTHPVIKNEIIKHINSNKTNKYIIVDAPVLIEAGLKDVCDCTVCVVADDKLRKKRIILRDNLKDTEAESRISAQKPDGFYIDNTDICIINNGDDSLDKLAESVLERSSVFVEENCT